MADVNYKTFLNKKGLPVTLVKTSKVIKDIYPLKSLYDFFKTHPYFWMIPIATPTDKVVGFILRGFHKKEYRTVFDHPNLAPLFGFEDFKDFKTNKPVILCEGAKDAIYLKSIYPYVLSLNTSSITNVNLEIISKLTDKLILCYDNDSVGIKSSKEDCQLLKSKFFACECITPTHKDCAEFISDKFGEDSFVDNLKYKINILGG